ncbi:acyl-CoA thioesterase [Natrarchaeobius halalkaliphilus]|uniref:Acyl-CoA thioesterase n=1 Tax=Natrarchaeobius halalkaliphilus TaxID=1679091 RepID=A0A3N6M543_9EURY|nr:thioesterase family protein [Natrarchaeobius halalkaliphilus]RQG90381.1 acyl-CoA thioesterase [Natrarchaeobius halalkaliphilus]
MSDPFTVDVPVRYRDLDTLNHVNHAVYATYLETARIDYFESLLEEKPQDLSYVVANLEISYERPITRSDEPTVATWVSELGETSCTMRYEIRTDDDVAATAETTMVYVDPETVQPAPVPDDVRTRIETSENLDAAAE